MADTVNGAVISDGRASFQKMLKISIENKMRKTTSRTARLPKAVRGKGIVGVLVTQYEPQVTSREDQEGIREHMQNMHSFDSDSMWDWEDITRDLENSYELQRQHMILAKEKIEKQSTVASDEEEENPDEVEEMPALKNLKCQWPFLFTVQGMKTHHKRLTGRNIEGALEDFVGTQLDMVLLFLTSCSSANTDNLALRIRLESQGNFENKQQQFLAFFKMIAAHFKEKEELFLKNVEV
jgi:hypothetical protein